MVRNYCCTLHCPECSSLTAVAVPVVVDSRVFGCRFQHFVVCAYICYSQLPLPEFPSAFHLIKIRHRTKFWGIRQEMSAFLRNRTPVSSPSPPGIGYPSFKLFFQHMASCMRFRNPGYFCLWDSEFGKILQVKSGILGFRIRNTAQGIRNLINDWNLESTFQRQRLESSSWNPESRAWNPDPRLSWTPLHGAKHGRRSGRKVYYCTNHHLTIM